MNAQELVDLLNLLRSDPFAVSTPDLEALIRTANEMYRRGEPIISDDEYDNLLIAELVNRDPGNQLLQRVEPEPVSGPTVQLPKPMLSTQKAYSLQELRKWYADVQMSATILGIHKVEVRVTPKLDGFAAQVWHSEPDQVMMATRGDGEVGQNISHAIDRGLAPDKFSAGDELVVEGPGEIVVRKDYFEQHLSGVYENTRNVIAAAIKAGELDPLIQKAMIHKGIVFAPFNMLTGFHLFNFEVWLTEDSLNHLWDAQTEGPYNTDGIVIEVCNPEIKEHMGSTSHHHRWQIAYKRNTEFHDCVVTGITWQTARTGRITPVINIEPTKIGGVTVSNVTGHHAGNIMNHGIGAGAVVKVTRAGQVIPHVVEILKSVPTSWPDSCPSCGRATYTVGDNLFCPDEDDCPAQVSGQIEHFFKSLGVDGFGPAICDQLSSKGLNYRQVLFASSRTLVEAGISEGVADNLWKNLQELRNNPIRDYDLLAALGIAGVGVGVAKKVLSKFTLAELYRVTKEELMLVEGCGETLSGNLLAGIGSHWPTLVPVLKQVNVVTTKSFNFEGDSPIAGKRVVFTGTLQSGTRTQVERKAADLGAIVQSSVSAKTDFLIVGGDQSLATSKMQAATKHGVTVLSEAEYLEKIE